MKTIERSTGTARACVGAVLMLVLASGCATSMSSQESQERAKLAKSHFDLGIDHMDNGRFAVALRELRIAASYDDSDPRIQVALAEAYMHRGKPAESEAHLLRALEIYPEYHDARLNLSALYLMTGRWAEAAAESRILIDDPTFPGIWRAYTNLATAELRSGNLQGAREHLEVAREFQPTYWPALLTLGILESEAGRPEAAIPHFEKVLEQKAIPAARAEANYHLAQAHVALGNRDKAVAHLKTALVITPDGVWGKKSEEYLKILR